MSEYPMYFIIQTGWKSGVESVTREGLINQHIVGQSEWDKEIEELLGFEIDEFNADDVYRAYSDYDSETLFIIPAANADFRLKTLSIDGMYFWGMTDFTAYPLVAYTVNEEYAIDPRDITSYAAGGEVIPARDILNWRIDSGHGPLYNFANVKEYFSNAEITSVILENAITSNPPLGCHYGCFSFIGNEDFKNALGDIGLDVVGVGNHIGDYQESALNDTITALRSVGIATTGMSTDNQTEASQPVLIKANGVSFGFLGYEDVAYFYWAGEENSWGSARASYRDEDGTLYVDEAKLRKDVDRVKDNVDVLVVNISWGAAEYVNYPDAHQEALAHVLVDLGVDVIIGTHQHWVNAIEYYNGGVIFYGLGNFLFDQTHTEETRQGMLLKLYFLEDRLVSYAPTPIITWGHHQTQLMNQMVSRGEITEPYNLYQPYIVPKEDEVYSEVFSRMLMFSDIQ